MILPVGRGEQELVVVEKSEQGVVQRATLPVRFVPMTGEAQRPR
jgi:protein-L-isoaspartate O-methyltransferase